jgi:hypothetical protein
MNVVAMSPINVIDKGQGKTPMTLATSIKITPIAEAST